MKIAIAGYGVEGKANYAYWRDRGEVTIVDEREFLDDAPQGVSTILGSGAFLKLEGFDLVVRTAGLAPYKIKTDGKIWSATNEFFANCPAPIIGVTGTKGKGTVSSWIASILEAAGKKVHLVGNIGRPAIEVINQVGRNDIVVYELSSFQLWDIRKSPHVAVILPIEADHLDVHLDFDDYISAKQHIVIEQNDSDIVIFHDGNEWSRKIAELSSADKHIAYPFNLGELADCVKLPGVHNFENASAAVAAARQFTDDKIAIKRGISEFTGLPHRLKFVAEKNGVRYYDDSIGTTVGSSIAAINSFSQPKVIILGGSSKGTSYDEVVKACRDSDTKVLAIGQTGAEIAELCHQYGVVVERIDGLMDDVVKKANEIAHEGDVVILSPASASFDQYKNYADRGDKFIAAVRNYQD